MLEKRLNANSGFLIFLYSGDYSFFPKHYRGVVEHKDREKWTELTVNFRKASFYILSDPLSLLILPSNARIPSIR